METVEALQFCTREQKWKEIEASVWLSDTRERLLQSGNRRWHVAYQIMLCNETSLLVWDEPADPKLPYWKQGHMPWYYSTSSCPNGVEMLKTCIVVSKQPLVTKSIRRAQDVLAMWECAPNVTLSDCIAAPLSLEWLNTVQSAIPSKKQTARMLNTLFRCRRREEDAEALDTQEGTESVAPSQDGDEEEEDDDVNSEPASDGSDQESEAESEADAEAEIDAEDELEGDADGEDALEVEDDIEEEDDVNADEHQQVGSDDDDGATKREAIANELMSEIAT